MTKEQLIELLKKHSNGWGPAYIREEGPGFVVIDGSFDLDALVEELEHGAKVSQE